MLSQTYISEFKQEHLEQATALLTRSFLQLNSIWKSYQPKYQEIYPIMRGKIIPAIGTVWATVLMRGQKVIGTSISYQLLDYLRMPSMPSDLELFKVLGKAGEKLEEKVDYSDLKKGDAVYGLYAVIDPAEANKGLSLYYWWQALAMGKIGGWKYYYSRISSPASLKLLLKLGAEIMAQTDCQNQKIWMIRIDLRKPWPSYSMIHQMQQSKKNKQPKAKL